MPIKDPSKKNLAAKGFLAASLLLGIAIASIDYFLNQSLDNRAELETIQVFVSQNEKLSQHGPWKILESPRSVSLLSDRSLQGSYHFENSQKRQIEVQWKKPADSKTISLRVQDTTGTQPHQLIAEETLILNPTTPQLTEDRDTTK